ncbi:damage-control phosphatase ARMT1 family protein [Kitasatospora cathayae]|uniref:Damage-control phosphatase ARMT1 family protein n=1 Tax=Kitasatospora cathayae TaxID=3004092 RepID=A0ABY7PXP5_9ACTN|nr:damage-control phosphatase ARMT1 family protein [Kitasatospora sp. HUAS 3-15]WBP84969.1 damage-control phosphatase ARMT1 family protein [Kitasatospora sp. HUAS 3-15]
MSDAPVIRSDVPGSFPWAVFHERHPRLVRQVLDALPYGPAERAAVERLLVESTTGVLEPLGEDAPDAAQWREWGGLVWGRPWGEAPFLWAESYFYRRLLDAIGYFRPGAWQGIDPFAPFKNAELAGVAVDEELVALSELDALPRTKRAEALLSSALWGNRADLGFQITAGPGGPASSGLLADDSAVLWSELDRAGDGRVCVVADNAGRELLPDLVLIDHLLTDGRAAEVVLYVKPQPYFVSDATTADVLASVDRLRTAPSAAAQAVGSRLWQALNRGTLVLRTHPFFCAPLPYHDLPADLRAELAGAALTILKGDLNYRRLVGDRLWPPTTPFAETAGHFPSAVAALRTLKSDVIVGLDAATVARLDGTGTTWRVDGRHAVIQVCAGS